MSIHHNTMRRWQVCPTWSDDTQSTAVLRAADDQEEKNLKQ